MRAAEGRIFDFLYTCYVDGEGFNNDMTNIYYYTFSLDKGLFSVDPNFIVYEPDTRPETQEAASPKIQFRF